MKNIVILLLVILASSCSTSYKIPKDIISSNLAVDIMTLSDDNMKGREVGTIGEKMAAEYIIKRYKEIGLEPMGENGTYIQKFTAYDKNPHANPHTDMPNDAVPINGKNIVGFIDNQSAHTVIIGAHYDHLGMGAFGSLYRGPAEIHNGADDNASGVAVLLLLAERLKEKGYHESNYLFVSFSGEERGLWGSNYFTKNPTIDLKTAKYMMNFDMVGRLKDDKLAINGTGTSPSWTVLDEENKKFELIKSASGIGPSDHSSFYIQEVPAIHFFTGQHEDYHRPSDDHDKINYRGCFEIANYVLEIIEELNEEGKLEFTKTKDDSQEKIRFNVTLGIIPDYMYSGKGMRIDGVTEGKTASVGGLVKGDIILQMGKLEVNDMQDYMKALGIFEKGQTIEVKYEREGNIETREITFL